MLRVSTFCKLWCNAEVKFKTASNIEYEYFIDNGPCFGMYTHSPISRDQGELIHDVEAVVYQTTRRSLEKVSKEGINNLCSLSPEQLEKFHRELEVVFEDATPELKSGIQISFTTKRKQFQSLVESSSDISVEVYEIKVRLECITHFGLRALLTCIRLSSEYPTALLLREIFNIKDSGEYKEFSYLQLFQAALLRLNYHYDQGISPYFNESRPTSEYFIKPLNLKRLGLRVTYGTKEQKLTQNQVTNILEVVEWSESVKKKFGIPEYYFGGTTSEYGEDALYYNKDVKEIFEGATPNKKSFDKIISAIKAQFSKLIVDYPEKWTHMTRNTLRKILSI